MKKLIVIAILLMASPAFAWNLFFIASQEDIGDGVMGYKLGPDDTIVQLSRCTNLKTVGATHLFRVSVKNTSLVNEIVTTPWSEFRAIGDGMNPYLDFAMRIALGLSSGSVNELKHTVGAHWYAGGEWHFGSVADWETAGSPASVMFGPIMGFFGMDFVGIGD